MCLLHLHTKPFLNQERVAMLSFVFHSDHVNQSRLIVLKYLLAVFYDWFKKKSEARLEWQTISIVNQCVPNNSVSFMSHDKC